jgi:hypothetical protein
VANPFCPSDAVLMRQALRADDRAVAAHAAVCDRCRPALEQLKVLAGELRRADESDGTGTGCLDELAVARVVDGGGTAAELGHLLQCAACRTAVAAVASAMGQEPLAAEIERLELPAHRGWQRRVLAFGAVAAVIAVTVALARTPGTGRAADPVYRDVPPVAGAGPVGLTPADAVVSRPIHLVWKRAAEARQYRVTVFDAEGSIAWEGTTADTAAAIPASVPLAEGVSYWWRVEARVGFDRWSQSEVTPFTIGRPAASAPAKGR